MTSMILGEKFAVIWIAVPILICHFALIVFKILYSVFKSLIVMCRDRFWGFILLEDCSASWIARLVFCQVRVVFSHEFFKYFSVLSLSSLCFCDSNEIYFTHWYYPASVCSLYFFHTFPHCSQIDLFLVTYRHVLFVIFILVLYSGYVLNLKCCIFHCFLVESSQLCIHCDHFFLKFPCTAPLNLDPLLLVSDSRWVVSVDCIFCWE